MLAQGELLRVVLLGVGQIDVRPVLQPLRIGCCSPAAEVVVELDGHLHLDGLAVAVQFDSNDLVAAHV
ncbi:MAG: hypothetical protein IPG46_19030 [Actinobacteria bacterium]|nr:hypothetical protein [Actinomycetota bacterium]